MTDEDEDEEITHQYEVQNEKGERLYYIKSNRTISDLSFEETNSFIN